MLQPVEFQTNRPAQLPGGHSATTAEIWQMFTACSEGELGAIRELVERCPGLAHAEYNYTPPIHFAVREGRAAVVRYLLDRGADPTYRTYGFQDSLLQMARERGHDDVAAMVEEALAGMPMWWSSCWIAVPTPRRSGAMVSSPSTVQSSTIARVTSGSIRHHRLTPCARGGSLACCWRAGRATTSSSPRSSATRTP